jgi:hypothetical protein
MQELSPGQLQFGAGSEPFGCRDFNRLQNLSYDYRLETFDV